MRALFFDPGRSPEIVELESFEDKLGGEIETLWPFGDLDVCVVALCEREDLEPNRILFGRTIRGPFFVSGFTDEYEDLNESDAEKVEGLFVLAEEEYREEPADPFEEDAQEEKTCGHIQIVDEETFFRMLKEESR